MKRYLITGGCGFIGSNFINFIHSKEPNSFVVNVDKLDYCSDIRNVDERVDTTKYVLVEHTICDATKNAHFAC